MHTALPDNAASLRRSQRAFVLDSSSGAEGLRLAHLLIASALAQIAMVVCALEIVVDGFEKRPSSMVIVIQ